jgi:hypothetical protein
MLIIDSTTVLTEGDRDSIGWCCLSTLAREYETFSSDSHLMDEPLSLECIDDTIEGCEIHTAISLPNELALEVGEGDTRALAESFDEPLALFCNTSIRHDDSRLVSSDW